MKEDYQKAVKKLSLFFLLSPVPFNGQIYQKQKGSGTTHQALFRPWKKFRKIPLIVSYILFDQVWWCNGKAVFESYIYITKITSANLCKSFNDIINYLTSICPFESGKCGKEGKKSQKFEYLENKKSFWDEIKNTFHSF